MYSSLDQIILGPQSKIFDALKVINEGGAGISLIVDQGKKLLGVLTDGDIRRAMLRGESLDVSVAKVMNTQFISENPGLMEHEALALMRRLGLKHLPIQDCNQVLCDLYCLDQLLQPRALLNAVVIMAGGKGTRLLPHTLDCPKPMLLVGGKPMLEIVIEQCSALGLRKIFLSVNYLKDQIIGYFGDGKHLGADIQYLIEDQPLGTAGSLQLLPPEINSPFLVMNGDVLTHLDFRHLLSFHCQHGGIATIGAREHEVTIPFGVIKHNNAELLGLEEKPSLNFLVNAGLYVLDPSILSLLQKGQSLDMPSLLMAAKTAGHQVNVCPVHEYWLDVGRPETLQQAEQEWKAVS